MPTDRSTFIAKLVRRTAQAAIGPSALRKQGAAGVVSAARDGAADLDLRRLAKLSGSSFASFLDEATDTLLAMFPKDARNWGAARKGINLYLRDAAYNVDLSAEFGLDALRPYLEVPLDKDVGLGLRAQPEGHELPNWDSIKRLSSRTSQLYQTVATAVAARHGVCRVDLDVYFWRPREGET
jgi:hypothetical protein